MKSEFEQIKEEIDKLWKAIDISLRKSKGLEEQIKIIINKLT